MKKILVFGLLVCVLLSGCAQSIHLGKARHSLGREFSNKDVSLIQQGVTTMDEIQRLFGQPHAIRVKPDAVTWVYSHIPTTIEVNLVKGRLCHRDVDVETQTRLKVLKVTFKDKIVQEYFYTTYMDEELKDEIVSMLDEDLADLLPEKMD